MANNNSKEDEVSDKIINRIAAGMVLTVALFIGFAWGMLGTTIALCKHHRCNPYPESVESTKNNPMPVRSFKN